MKYLNEANDFKEKTLPLIKTALEGIIANAENQNLLIVLSVADNRCATDMLMGNQHDLDEFFMRLSTENNEIFQCLERGIKRAKQFKKYIKKRKASGGMDDKLREALDGLKELKKGLNFGSDQDVSEMFGKLIDRDPNFFMIAQHRMIELFEQKGIPTPASIKEAANGDELMKAFKGAKDLINKF